jgi:alpha-tubulin suppressor-like RCC1 family protein
VRRFGAFVLAGVATLGVACGRGVSENPLSGSGEGGGSGGSGAGSGEVTGGTSGMTGGSGGTTRPGASGGTTGATGGESGGGVAGGASGSGGWSPLSDGKPCGSASECRSGRCEPTVTGATVCCETSCDDPCQRCSPNGQCDDSPATDERCDAVTCEPNTRCVTYRLPARGACSSNGECTQCKATFTREGVPCGAGRRCDGQGACELDASGRIAVGERHTCMVDDFSNVLCWGDNRFGQLGAVFERQRVGFDEQPRDVPDRELDFGSDVVQVTAGAQHSCALFDTGGVRCWGTMYDHPTFGRINSIWGTVGFVFALGTEGLPPGAVGPLATFGFIDPLNTEDVILPEKAEQISAAPDGATICALLESGKISCWGLNNFGQLGIGNTIPLDLTHLEVLDAVDLGERAVEVRSAFAHTCALTQSGLVHCWGDGLYGRLGSGQEGPRNSPGAPVEIGEPAMGLALGFDHACVVLEGGAVRCWGNNHQGQLGYGHTLPIGDDETPAAAASLEGPAGRPVLGGDVDLGGVVKQVVTFPASSSRGSSGIWDSSPTCALTEDKYVRCWGRNDAGELGYGHNQAGATENTPFELGVSRESDRFVRVGGDVLALAPGGRCALRVADDEGETGSLYCWGPNDEGQLGVGQMGTPGTPRPSVTKRPIDLGPVHWW